MESRDMVDCQKKNLRVTKLEQIIAKLKQQSQHNQNDYMQNQGNEIKARGKDNSSNVSGSFSQICKKNKGGSPKIQSNITDYFSIGKTAAVSKSSIKDVTIWNILRTLRTNKENSLVTNFEGKGSKNSKDTSYPTQNHSSNSGTDIINLGKSSGFENESSKNNIDTNKYQTQSHSSNNETDISLAKSSSCNILRVVHDNYESNRQLINSTETIGKAHNYNKRQNNKRLKICNNTNQSVVTDFFNVDQRTGSSKAEKNFCDTIGSVTKVAERNFIGCAAIDNKCFDTLQVKKSVTESQRHSRENLHDKKYDRIGNTQFVLNKGQSTKLDLKIFSGKIHGTDSLQGSHFNLKNKRKVEKPLDISRKFKIENYTKQIHQNKNILRNDKAEHLQNLDVKKKVISRNRDQDKTSFDDFCSDVVRIISQNSNEKKKIESGESKEQLQFLHPTTNFFPKSHSTGILAVEKQINSCKDLSSLPVTDKEIRSRNEKLMQGKISFDDFMENILKDLSDSKSDKKNCEGYIEDMYMYNPDEKNTVDAEYKKSKIKNMSGNLKNDKQVTPIVTSHTLKSTLCSNENHDSQNILQKSDNIGPGHNILKTKNHLEHLKLLSTNYSETCNDTNQEEGIDLKCNMTLSQHNEDRESESEDFLSYFKKTRNSSNQLMRESPAKLLAGTDNLTNTDCNKQYNYALPSSLNLCKEISFEVPQDAPNVLQINRLLNEKGAGYEGGSSYPHISSEYPNFTESNTYIDSNNQNVENINEETHYNVLNDNLSENNLANIIVFENDQLKNDTEQFGINRTEKLNDILEKLLKHNTLECDTNHGKSKIVPRRMYIKRYRKGKTKIYKLKKLKKICPKMDIVEEHEENLNFNDIFKKIITQDFVETENSCRMRSKSMSSISTSSSYVTDITRSEILSTGSNELSSPKQRLRKGFNELCKDKSLLYCEDQWENTAEYDKDEIKMKIQEIISKVVEDFLKKDSSSFKYRKQSFNNCIFKDGRLQLKPLAESSMTVINSKAQRSQSKFTLILYLLKKIQKLLETDTKLTKRELYYQLKTLIKDQNVTDRAVNAISNLLNVGMWALNIVAQKGLVFGNLKILLSSGETLNCNIPGTLIPQDINDIVEIASPAYFILVVEKESIFYKLIEEDLPNRLTRPFIMITGKGFPDLNTQLFLKKMWIIMSIPVFILVDADPHGINIMLNYRFGSVNNAHVSHQLAVPNAKWLGVYPSEVINLNITRELLSERELKLVNHLLRTPYMDCNPRIVDELKVLLETKCKAEIEGLIKSDTYLSEVYLPNKFFTHNFI